MTNTDITDQDRHAAREWATTMEKHGAVSPPIRAAARVILATVEAPALSEELADITEHWESWDTDAITSALTAATTRADQMEHDLAKALAEVERLADVNETLRRTDNFKEFRERLADVQKDTESNAESPDPADVKPGEAWLVRDEQELSVAVRDAERWVLIRLNDATIRYRRIQHITLIFRLVPAPRVITDPDELDRLPRRAVIISMDRQADVYQKDSDGEWVDVTSYGHSSREVIRIENAVTVLWEPGAWPTTTTKPRHRAGLHS